jgi:drug/metabolite transporter (DMT)-like permease
MNWKTVFLMIISTVAFAIVNSIIKYFEEYSEFQLVFFRCVISLIISGFQLRLLKISPWGNNKPVLILRGFAGVLALIMGFVLIKNVPLGTAIMLNYLSPIFTAFIAVFWLKEKVKPLQWFYLFICVLGVWILKNGELSLTFNLLLLGLGASSLAGLAYNCVRVCRTTDHPLVVVLYFPLIGTPVALVLTLLFQEWIWPTAFDWMIIVVLGTLTQVAQITLTKALQSDKAANVTVLKYLGVVHAFIIGWLFFGEQISILSGIGTLVVLMGVVLFSWKRQLKTID